MPELEDRASVHIEAHYGPSWVKGERVEALTSLLRDVRREALEEAAEFLGSATTEVALFSKGEWSAAQLMAFLAARLAEGDS